MTHIKLTRCGRWVAVENAGGGKSVATAEFLAKAYAAGSFERVCFGDKGYAGASTYALPFETEAIVGFQGWAYEHGLNASFME